MRFYIALLIITVFLVSSAFAVGVNAVSPPYKCTKEMDGKVEKVSGSDGYCHIFECYEKFSEPEAGEEDSPWFKHESEGYGWWGHKKLLGDCTDGGTEEGILRILDKDGKTYKPEDVEKILKESGKLGCSEPKAPLGYTMYQNKKHNAGGKYILQCIKFKCICTATEDDGDCYRFKWEKKKYISSTKSCGDSLDEILKDMYPEDSNNDRKTTEEESSDKYCYLCTEGTYNTKTGYLNLKVLKAEVGGVNHDFKCGKDVSGVYRGQLKVRKIKMKPGQDDGICNDFKGKEFESKDDMAAYFNDYYGFVAEDVPGIGKNIDGKVEWNALKTQVSAQSVSASAVWPVVNQGGEIVDFGSDEFLSSLKEEMETIRIEGSARLTVETSYLTVRADYMYLEHNDKVRVDIDVDDELVGDRANNYEVVMKFGESNVVLESGPLAGDLDTTLDIPDGVLADLRDLDLITFNFRVDDKKGNNLANLQDDVGVVSRDDVAEAKACNANCHIVAGNIPAANLEKIKAERGKTANRVTPFEEAGVGDPWSSNFPGEIIETLDVRGLFGSPCGIKCYCETREDGKQIEHYILGYPIQWDDYSGPITYEGECKDLVCKDGSPIVHLGGKCYKGRMAGDQKQAVQVNCRTCKETKDVVMYRYVDGNWYRGEGAGKGPVALGKTSKNLNSVLNKLINKEWPGWEKDIQEKTCPGSWEASAKHVVHALYDKALVNLDDWIDIDSQRALPVRVSETYSAKKSNGGYVFELRYDGDVEGKAYPPFSKEERDNLENELKTSCEEDCEKLVDASGQGCIASLSTPNEDISSKDSGWSKTDEAGKAHSISKNVQEFTMKLTAACDCKSPEETGFKYDVGYQYAGSDFVMTASIEDSAGGLNTFLIGAETVNEDGYVMITSDLANFPASDVAYSASLDIDSPGISSIDLDLTVTSAGASLASAQEATISMDKDLLGLGTCTCSEPGKNDEESTCVTQEECRKKCYSRKYFTYMPKLTPEKFSKFGMSWEPSSKCPECQTACKHVFAAQYNKRLGVYETGGKTIHDDDFPGEFVEWGSTECGKACKCDTTGSSREGDEHYHPPGKSYAGYSLEGKCVKRITECPGVEILPDGKCYKAVGSSIQEVGCEFPCDPVNTDISYVLTKDGWQQVNARTGARRNVGLLFTSRFNNVLKKSSQPGTQLIGNLFNEDGTLKSDAELCNMLGEQTGSEMVNEKSEAAVTAAKLDLMSKLNTEGTTEYESAKCKAIEIEVDTGETTITAGNVIDQKTGKSTGKQLKCYYKYPIVTHEVDMASVVYCEDQKNPCPPYNTMECGETSSCVEDNKQITASCDWQGFEYLGGLIVPKQG